MKINIPCPDCGCQVCNAEKTTGEKVTIEICQCNGISNQYDVTIIPENNEDSEEYEKHQCSEDEIAICLTTRFRIDLNSMSHKCFN